MATTEQTLVRQLAAIAEKSPRQYDFTRVDHCRYEFAVSWKDLDKHYFRAKNTVRVSFAYDLRAIEHTPAYSIRYKDVLHPYDESIELSFNRMLPTTFDYIDSEEFRSHPRNRLSDSFIIASFDEAPAPLLKQLLVTLKDLATQCGGHLIGKDDIQAKVPGRWEISDNDGSLGTLTITSTQASLKLADKPSHSGNFRLTRQGDYYRMTIKQQNGVPYHLLLDFVDSNYARLLLLGNSTSAVPFAPIWSSGDYNPEEKNLFRLGELR